MKSSRVPLLERVAGRSYRHVNHFDKIVLIDDGDASHFRLTMHFWRPPYLNGELDDELIHDHRFTFWSKVLCGTLQSQNFKRSTSGSEFRAFSYCPENENKDAKNIYRYEGPVSLERTDFCQNRARPRVPPTIRLDSPSLPADCTSGRHPRAPQSAGSDTVERVQYDLSNAQKQIRSPTRS